MSNIECDPGFTQSSFNALSEKIQKDYDEGRTTICSLMLDEMAISIKKQIEFHNGKTWGYVDIGSDIIDDSLPCASEALVPMLVSVNSHWKIPIAYYLIKSLTASEKANIVKHGLIKLHELSIMTTSLTCDGPNTHFAMAEELGANFRDINNITPYFEDASSGNRIYTVFDACHMIKLMRNNWAALGDIFDGNGNRISFDYVKKLYEIQDLEGCRLGTKVRRAHIEWERQKMKVNLAAQTLSASVADAIEFLQKDVGHPFFVDATATINFIKTIDILFDLCNSRNPVAKGWKSPLRSENEYYWKPKLQECIAYLKTLRNKKGTALYLTRNKTPIKGFIITALSLLGIYEDYVKEGLLNYFLTYKVSQDHLELFFLNVRSRNGWNNNPTSYQFYHTYKRLLAVHDFAKIAGNCTTQDETTILTVAQTKKRSKAQVITIDDVSILKKYNLQVEDMFNDNVTLMDHDYMLPTLGKLSDLTDNVVVYIAGFVVRSLKKHLKCATCILALEQEKTAVVDDSGFKLLCRKNRGGLLEPSNDVAFICRQSERYLKRILNVTDNKLPQEENFHKVLLNRIYQDIIENNCFADLKEHIFDTSPEV